MNVQHITEKWVCGGIESLLIDLCKATEGHDVRNSLVHLYEDHRRGEVAAPLRTSGVRMIRKLRIDPCGLWRLRRLIRKERPDVLHCHGYYPAACALALRAAGIHIPIVYTVHANLDRGIQRSDAFVMRVAQGCEKVVAVSWKTAESIQRFTNGVISPRVIPNGMDLSRIELPSSFSPEKKRQSIGIEQRTTVFCSVAVLTNQKDHPTLLRSFANLIGEGKDAALLVVGDGQERESLRTLAHELKIENRVRFLGKRSDIAELLAISQVFVLSSHGEGLPISIIEAACAGVPVIATDVGGISDLLKLGIDVRLTPHGDVDDLTRAMREASGSCCSSKTAESRTHSRAIFAIEKTAEQYRDVYEELCRGASIA